ncbi:pyridoxamine 5'-phosphate oxidase family protein [Actinomycetospora endophytica]|uniref:Pyridoxamine 5'-phosphate oxidase family protein n=1 Tax=Actinomycetospora endophytica TaxID=2291215 RepID=A0ABS8P1A3_9PSEU|nr:pyridoxamine 5'-phosphate oxidase family protein [Actinomycetospora endophytica]MCD2192038.1 pyridoxamine 5'-phosphate oxidase family protein [Actinomycetospora endophytica]
MSTTVEIDRRFGNPEAEATPWATAESALRDSELYWLTTVRADGRPHVTPLVGVWVDDGFAFTTGPDEQKTRNLEHGPQVAVTTGVNTWAQGLDVVVEGVATRVDEVATLRRIAEAYDAKYAGDWHWEIDDGGFVAGDMRPQVFHVAPSKILAFGKAPHSQTRYRFR